MADTKELVLESEARDVRIVVKPAGVHIILHGHKWICRSSNIQSILMYDFIPKNPESMLEGHIYGVRSPADCPGCKEFVKNGG